MPTKPKKISLSNNWSATLNPNNTISGKLPSTGLTFTIRRKKMADAMNLERVMGGSDQLTENQAESALRLFLMLCTDMDHPEVEISQKDASYKILKNEIPIDTDLVYAWECLNYFSVTAPEGEPTQEGDRIVFPDGNFVTITDKGGRRGKFPDSGIEFELRLKTVGDDSLISKSMGGDTKVKQYAIQSQLRMFSRICTKWKDRNDVSYVELGDIEDGNDTNYLVNVMSSFRLLQETR